MKKVLYPMKFNPIFKEKLWGGRNLETLLGKSLPPNKKIGESWEICDRENDQTTVKNGIYQGVSIHNLIHELKQSLLGDVYKTIPSRFPLLFKIIDAQDDLSLQVHPDDDYASTHEKDDPGKTEMWYIFHSQNAAKIYCGLRDPAGFKKALQANQSISEFIRVYSSKAGDVFFIPAGTVHALGKEHVVIEIQQNSDITYRLNDWGRKGEDGKPRPLHIEKGLEVTDIDPKVSVLPYQEGRENTVLVICPYFTVSEIVYDRPSTEKIDPQTFQVWTILEGKGTIEKETYEKGEFLLIPAHVGHVTIQPSSLTRILKTRP